MTLNVCSHLIIAAVPLFPSRPFPLPLLSSPLRQLLIAADDWSTHAQGVPGTTRYRIANLPSQTGPGVYELGVLPNRVVRRQRRLQGLPVRVVYVGHSESVRSRMQQYGQSGSHLKELFEGVFAEDYSLIFRWTPVSRAVGLYALTFHWTTHLRELFEWVFAQDYALTFRWTPAVTKAEAAATETLLLSSFDYVWNVCNDHHNRLLTIIPWCPFATIPILIPLSPLSQATTKAEAAATETLLLSSFDYVWNVCNNHHRRHDRLLTKLQVGSSFSRRVAVAFPFLPVARLVTPVAVGPSISLASAAAAAAAAPLPDSPTASGAVSPSATRHSNHYAAKPQDRQPQDRPLARPTDKTPDRSPHRTPEKRQEDSAIKVCGAPLSQGGICRQAAVEGRVRCAEHKGMRVKASPEVSEAPEQAPQKPSSPLSESAFKVSEASQQVPLKVPHQKVDQNKKVPRNSARDVGAAVACGAPVNGGGTCQEAAVKGRVRCVAHKGIRVKGRAGL
ncbi:unnamed protein product [Closterium sp. Naga37s-1]|nr:unnamed protein product [Closterium sp. Naga37s-1]